MRSNISGSDNSEIDDNFTLADQYNNQNPGKGKSGTNLTKSEKNYVFGDMPVLQGIKIIQEIILYPQHPT